MISTANPHYARRFCLLTAWLVCLVAAPCLAAPAAVSESAPRVLQTLAVMPFATAGDPSGTELGRIAAQWVAAALSRDADLTIQDRTALPVLAAGSDEGLPETLPTASTRPGNDGSAADALVVGSLARFQDQLRLDCRLTRPSDGAVLAAFSALQPYTAQGAGDAAAQVAAAIGKAVRRLRRGQSVPPDALSVSVVARDPKTGALRTVMPGDVLAAQTRYKVLFTSRQDGYVYVYQMDSQGQLFQLFPMHSFHKIQLGNDNPVRAGKIAVLPAPDKAFVLDNAQGTEWIIVYRSPQPDTDLELLAASAAAFGDASVRALPDNRRGILLGAVANRGLGGIVSDTAITVPWTGNERLASNIQTFGLDGLQGAFVLEFRHE